MSDQHQYEIEIKQGDLMINLCSDDVYFISKQMDKWFKVLLDDSYVPIAVPSSKPATPEPVAVPTVAIPEPEPIALEIPTPEPVVAPEPIVIPEPIAQPVVEAKPEPLPIPEPMVIPEPVAPVLEIPDPVAATTVAIPEPEPVNPEMPPLPEPVAQVMLEPLPIPQPVALSQPAVIEKLDSAVQDDFEAVMDTLMKDLEKGESIPYQAPTTTATLPPLPPVIASVDLSDVSTLADLADRSKASSSEDYLLLTSYYIVHIENADDKFSLKRINSQLVKSGMTPVNHSVLESAISKNFLTMVPDLTGMADVSEYSLSPEGELQVMKLLA